MNIIFDLDGTLVDSLPDIHAAAGAMLVELGHAPLDVTTIRSFIGNGVEALVVRVMEAVGTSDDRAAWVECFGRHYSADSATLTRAFDGVPEALAALAGHRLAVCTNKPEALALAVLEALDLGPFDVVLGGDSLPFRKPHPEPLLETARRLGDGPVLYVGDSEVDEATAKAAGIDFALFTGGYRHTEPEAMTHRFRFDDYAELPGIVSRLTR
ncbi:phosphoglycolate phosphatase [Cereibacter sp. SYSU M97828]|nr:phosphoglycolate phosphatase [Cereibacter flavus]